MNPQPLQIISRRPAVAHAFTLVELLVSIALAVLLIAGVNEVFRLTTRTISASNALSDAIRDNRAVQTSLGADLHAAAVEDGPFFIIRSATRAAFRNRADLDADKDGSVTTADFNGTGTEVAGSSVRYDFRNHRIDVLAFFTADFQHRQTGDDGRYVSPTTSYEAYVNYGHMQVRNNSSATSGETSAFYLDPGEGNAQTNPNNYFATQWLLGRSQLLLLETPPSYGTPPVQEQYIADGGGANSPLIRDSQATQANLAGSGKYLIQQHRFDLAQTSFSQFRRKMILTNLADDLWGERFAYRFWSNPYTLKGIALAPEGISSRQVSQAANVFLRGCTQFIVEYAGDFLTQKRDVNNDGVVDATDLASPNYGKIDAAKPDGIVDFIPTVNNGTASTRTRWYGYFRDTGGASGGGPDGNINIADDVVPLSTVLNSVGMLPPAPGVSFEPNAPKTVPTGTVLSTTAPATAYVAVWRPHDLDKTNPDAARPSLIRITVTLDDPSGRLSDGQTYEYVYKIGF